MAGYVRQKKLFKLKFADPEFDGLVVLCKSVSIGEYFKLFETSKAAYEELDAAENLSELDEVDAEVSAIRQLIRDFSKNVLKWNLQEPEDPTDEDSALVDVPCTFEGMLTQEPDFIMHLVDTWMNAVGGVDSPLGKQSSNGGLSQEQQILTDLSSVSQVS